MKLKFVNLKTSEIYHNQQIVKLLLAEKLLVCSLLISCQLINDCIVLLFVSVIYTDEVTLLQ